MSSETEDRWLLPWAIKEPWLTKRWYDLRVDRKWRLSDGFIDRMLQE